MGSHILKKRGNFEQFLCISTFHVFVLDLLTCTEIWNRKASPHLLMTSHSGKCPFAGMSAGHWKFLILPPDQSQNFRTPLPLQEHTFWHFEKICGKYEAIWRNYEKICGNKWRRCRKYKMKEYVFFFLLFFSQETCGKYEEIWSPPYRLLDLNKFQDRLWDLEPPYIKTLGLGKIPGISLPI